MTNFYQTFVKKIGFFYNLIGAVVLGIIVGCVYSGCSYERIKVYLGSKKSEWSNKIRQIILRCTIK
ncbi:hypothetical protein EfaecalisJ4_05270 [Enterococcus faecalis]|nr:hypothetical protein EfaecalisJ4_05270 [Enterococcus faecalis]